MLAVCVVLKLYPRRGPAPESGPEAESRRGPGKGPRPSPAPSLPPIPPPNNKPWRVGDTEPVENLNKALITDPAPESQTAGRPRAGPRRSWDSEGVGGAIPPPNPKPR